MVGKRPPDPAGSTASARDRHRRASRARIAALPGLRRGRARPRARPGVEAYLVGGAVRDALLGADAREPRPRRRRRPPRARSRRSAARRRVHDRFGDRDGRAAGDGAIDVAAARAETYAAPGRAARGAPGGARRGPGAPRLHRQRDRGRRSPIPASLIDPHGGLADLRRRRCCGSCTSGSFADDPTRALRAARYAARLGLEVEPRTLELLRATDLATVSADRVDAELRRLAAEPAPGAAFELLDEWGLVELDPGAGGADRRAVAALARAPRRGRELVAARATRSSRPSRRAVAGASRAGRARAARRPRRRSRAARGSHPASSCVARAGARRRVARRLRRRAGAASGSRSPATTCSPPGSPRARRSAAASRRRCGRSSTARRRAATRSCGSRSRPRAADPDAV